MKRIILMGLVIAAAVTPVMAQEVMDDGSLVVLPIEAQACNLPSAPAPIPAEADYDDLVAAQGGVKQFQQAMEVYRACINRDALSPDLSSGNRQAITNAHNFSVDMEERVAGMFNEAVRSYKARKANEE